MSNKIEVVGTIANSERKNRDRGRVMSGEGVCMALAERDYKEPPFVLVKVKVKNDGDRDKADRQYIANKKKE